MNFVTTPLEGLLVVEFELHSDERGGFARVFDAGEWRAQGLNDLVVQCSISRNPVRGTLRGMHYQRAPHGEEKLVRCSRGAIFDVAVDLRLASPTFRSWYGAELTAENRRMLYIPDGFAHGFLTLADDSEVSYQMSSPYVPEAAAGVRWDDPAFSIRWPAEPTLVSERDRSFAPFSG